MSNIFWLIKIEWKQNYVVSLTKWRGGPIQLSRRGVQSGPLLKLENLTHVQAARAYFHSSSSTWTMKTDQSQEGSTHVTSQKATQGPIKGKHPKYATKITMCGNRPF